MPSVIGIDPSSTSLGWAYVDNGRPIAIGVWVPKPKSAKPRERLGQCHDFLHALFAMYSPDEICMEVIRVSTSHDTTRALSRIESAVLLAARAHGITAIHEHQVGEARAAVFSNGNIAKLDAHNVMRQTYPYLDWLSAMSGKSDGPGLDQSDALVAALAHEKLALRPNGKAIKRKRRRQ